jgi:hypothetical protein
MSVSEEVCKKVFTKLTSAKKQANQTAAKSKGKQSKKAKNVGAAIVQSLGLDIDGSDVHDDLVETEGPCGL